MKNNTSISNSFIYICALSLTLSLLSLGGCSSDDDDVDVGTTGETENTTTTTTTTEMTGGTTVETGGVMTGGVMTGGTMVETGGVMTGGVMNGGEMTGGVMTGGVMNGGEMTGGEMPWHTCTQYCDYLESCDSCFYDDAGECLDQAGCVNVCEAEVPPMVAECVIGLDTCDEESYLGCYDENIGDDDCAAVCRLIDGCGECFVNEEDECLSLAECALACRGDTPAPVAACIAQLTECDGIDACYEM
jgi:hypothetical protein